MTRPNEARPKAIDGRARTVWELLHRAKYAIDFYQREYAWKESQVRELIDGGDPGDFHDPPDGQWIWV